MTPINFDKVLKARGVDEMPTTPGRFIYNVPPDRKRIADWTAKPPIFVDTNGWYSFVDMRSPHFTQAREVFTEAFAKGYTFVTSAYVVSELIALLTGTAKFHRRRALMYIRRVRTTAWIIPVSPELDEKAWDVLFDPDNERELWSHVDVTSFINMRQEGIEMVMTADNHFREAGFQCLLGPAAIALP